MTSLLVNILLITFTENGDADNSDDDVEMGGLVQDYRDPLTRGWLEDPMTSYASLSSYNPTRLCLFLHIRSVVC
jgi:hypothetical protein